MNNNAQHEKLEETLSERYAKPVKVDKSKMKRYATDTPWSSLQRRRPDLSKGRYNLQDSYLAVLCADAIECDIMLRNEASIRGRVIDYDNWSLLIHHEERSYLIFKSGIMALIPLEQVKYSAKPEPYRDRLFAEPNYEYYS